MGTFINFGYFSDGGIVTVTPVSPGADVSVNGQRIDQTTVLKHRLHTQHIYIDRQHSTSQIQGGRGHWAGYYTIPQSFMITFSYSLALQI